MKKEFSVVLILLSWMVVFMLSQDIVMEILFFQLKKQKVNGIGVHMLGVEKVTNLENSMLLMEFTLLKTIFMLLTDKHLKFSSLMEKEISLNLYLIFLTKP